MEFAVSLGYVTLFHNKSKQIWKLRSTEINGSVVLGTLSRHSALLQFLSRPIRETHTMTGADRSGQLTQRVSEEHGQMETGKPGCV